jgi:hypothetical protein
MPTCCLPHRVAWLGILIAGQVSSLPAQRDRTAPASLPSGTHALDLITRPWIGDFDGMVRRRRLRILTPYSRTHYFVEHGVQRGIVFVSA